MTASNMNPVVAFVNKFYRNLSAYITGNRDYEEGETLAERESNSVSSDRRQKKANI